MGIPKRVFWFEKKIKRALLVMVAIILGSCKPFYNSVYQKPTLVDKKISKNVKKLHKKLFYISKNGFAIGHQDATAYGIGWKHSDTLKKTKSDVHNVIGDYPAVYGFDISKIELGRDLNIDSVPFNAMRDLIIDAYKKGGIITISWHADNPTSDGDSWDKTPTVSNIIGTGKYKAKYDSWLEKVAMYLKSLKYKGKKIPIVFRPYHEMNGSWFWWGDGNCTAMDYKILWQETVHSLRDTHGLHNLLFAYSPNRQNPEDDYLKYYPGDDYVDILGIDIYDFKDAEKYSSSVKNDLMLVKKLATEKNKLYALTETGLETISTPKWFSEVVYPSLKDSGISWILFWRNARKTHHYMPYKGHESEEDFTIFGDFPETLFLKDINTLKN